MFACKNLILSGSLTFSFIASALGSAVVLEDINEFPTNFQVIDQYQTSTCVTNSVVTAIAASKKSSYVFPVCQLISGYFLANKAAGLFPYAQYSSPAAWYDYWLKTSVYYGLTFDDFVSSELFIALSQASYPENFALAPSSEDDSYHSYGYSSNDNPITPACWSSFIPTGEGISDSCKSPTGIGEFYKCFGSGNSDFAKGFKNNLNSKSMSDWAKVIDDSMKHHIFLRKTNNTDKTVVTAGMIYDFELVYRDRNKSWLDPTPSSSSSAPNLPDVNIVQNSFRNFGFPVEGNPYSIKTAGMMKQDTNWDKIIDAMKMNLDSGRYIVFITYSPMYHKNGYTTQACNYPADSKCDGSAQPNICNTYCGEVDSDIRWSEGSEPNSHAMVVYGYDDSAEVKGIDGKIQKGVFYIRNSVPLVEGSTDQKDYNYYMTYDYMKEVNGVWKGDNNQYNKNIYAIQSIYSIGELNTQTGNTKVYIKDLTDNKDLSVVDIQSELGYQPIPVSGEKPVPLGGVLGCLGDGTDSSLCGIQDLTCVIGTDRVTGTLDSGIEGLIGETWNDGGPSGGGKDRPLLTSDDLTKLKYPSIVVVTAKTIDGKPVCTFNGW